MCHHSRVQRAHDYGRASMPPMHDGSDHHSCMGRSPLMHGNDPHSCMGRCCSLFSPCARQRAGFCVNEIRRSSGQIQSTYAYVRSHNRSNAPKFSNTGPCRPKSSQLVDSWPRQAKAGLGPQPGKPCRDQSNFDRIRPIRTDVAGGLAKLANQSQLKRSWQNSEY